MTTEDRWHSIGIDETLTKLKASLNGLTQEEASYRLKLYGFNELTTMEKLRP